LPSRPGPSNQWVADNHDGQSFDQLNAAMPKDEVDEGRAHIVESHADATAVRILRQRPLAASGQASVPLVVGSMSALALHSALWWSRAAKRRAALGWTHPFPELRLSMVGYQLAMSAEDWMNLWIASPPRAPDPNAASTYQQLATEGFREWLDSAMGTGKQRRKAYRQGFDDLGINYIDRIMLAAIRRLEEGDHPDER
jgi:hypothetical protein